jgi:1,4-dihydroxy-2-naphthoyl-CoA synthase
MSNGQDGTARDFRHRRTEEGGVIRVAILTGAGDRAFCAGVDLKSTIPGITSGKASSGDPAVRPFSSITKPIIAAVNGLALAGGTELLLGTDIRVAAEHAVFGLPEPSLGLAPEDQGSRARHLQPALGRGLHRGVADLRRGASERRRQGAPACIRGKAAPGVQRSMSVRENMTAQAAPRAAPSAS